MLHTNIPLAVPPQLNYTLLKADYGASKHFVRIEDKSTLTNVHEQSDNKCVILPNNERIQITEKGTLPLSQELSTSGKEASVLPNLKNSSLLPIGQLCDDNCNVTLDKEKMLVYKNNKVILKGYRNKLDGLWDVKVPRNITEQKINALVRLDGSKMDLANYIHACMFSPSPFTLQRAIRNKQLLTWPGIDQINFDKYMQDNVPTQLGHLRQERKLLRSIKHKQESKVDKDIFPPQEVKSYSILSQVFEFNSKQMAYGDMTGKFPFTSSRGNKYIYMSCVTMTPMSNWQ